MDIAVIGAGASGMAASIAAARAGASVTLYEHKESAGNKLLITGNGKCNFTNTDMRPECFHSSTAEPGRIGGILERFGTDDCLTFFESMGLLHRERKGGLYPYSDTAESVRSALILEMKRLGVSMMYGLEPELNLKERLVDGKSYDRVIIACGSFVSKRTGSDGSGYALLKKAGVEITPLYPALTPLVTKENLSALKGVRCEAALTLKDGEGRIRERSFGELQPYEHGFSGICAMDISGEACRILAGKGRAYAEADYLPLMSDEELETMLKHRRESYPERDTADLLTGIFPRKLINYLVHPVDSRRPDHLRKLTNIIKHSRYELSADMLTDFSRAQTVAGGVSFEQLDDDLMLNDMEGVYITGELIDADGICGGYNLHFAWASGIIAATNAAGSGI
ncbi:MAG: aminoacetone oxidase family FAD-binding enzyme [Lachnospiraceae bacterium]|nr:aminoacetone oxidase family FAD-binding enzyme [Lachnospiraceae bacterium]